MIVRMLNLTCGGGHRHYAPPAELVEWIGHDCLHGAGMRSNGFTVAGRCRHVLYPLTLTRTIGDSPWPDDPRAAMLAGMRDEAPMGRP